jgi:hypothetical protein
MFRIPSASLTADRYATKWQQQIVGSRTLRIIQPETSQILIKSHSIFSSDAHKHRVACHGLVHRDLFLQNVPVLDDSVILEAEDIDRNQRFPGIA